VAGAAEAARALEDEEIGVPPLLEPDRGAEPTESRAHDRDMDMCRYAKRWEGGCIHDEQNAGTCCATATVGAWLPVPTLLVTFSHRR
jgi:hypothetical protein